MGTQRGGKEMEEKLLELKMTEEEEDEINMRRKQNGF